MLESTSSLKRPSLLIRWISGKGMGRIFFVTFLIIGIVFGTSTIEYFFNYNNKSGPVWDKALGLMTSDWFATGKELLGRRVNQFVLIVSTTL